MNRLAGLSPRVLRRLSASGGVTAPLGVRSRLVGVCAARGAQQRRFFNQGRQEEDDSDKAVKTPADFVREFRKDIDTFPEYFNAVTFTIFGAIMAYLLYITSNSRGKAWFFRHFTLSKANLEQGRLHTILTHPLLETSLLSLVINLSLLRWGGNMVLNLGGGSTGFVRALGILSVVPGVLHGVAGGARQMFAPTEEFVTIGGAVVPASHFYSSTRDDVLAGMHGLTAGLVANGVLEMRQRFPASTILGLRSHTALPALTLFYFLLASSGSGDAWLSLCGIATAVTHRRFLGRGF